MSDAIQLPSISLYFNDGQSDKEYHCSIQPKADGFVVVFSYGRRGSTLTAGCKTPAPVTLDEAAKCYNKLTREKMGKGYSPGEAGTPFQDTEFTKRDSGVRLQLLNVISEAEANRLVCNPEWVLEQKHDGDRRAVKIAGGEVIGINKKHLTVALPVVIAQSLLGMTGINQAVFDAEIVGEHLHIWDILEHDGADVTNLPHGARLAILGAYPFAGAVSLTTVYRTTEEKRAALAMFRATGAEGVTFKRANAVYRSGRPTEGGDALKFPFTASATVRIAGFNGTKRSVQMEVMDADGTWTFVGSVTIPANHKMPAVGDIAEVRYLYAMRQGSLMQPVWKGSRLDNDASDCLMAQLQYKGEGISVAA